MAQDNRMLKGVVFGLLAGGVIGAVLALLYAPKSGKELRADLKEKADDLLEGADGYVQAARTKASTLVSEAKKRSDSLVTDAQKKAQTLMEDADKVLSGARRDTAKFKDAVKAGVDAFKDERNRS
jgi:gas vesicle protein